MMKIFLSLALLLVISITSIAAEPSIWTVSSRAEILRGDARNVSIDSEGSIRLSPRLAEVYKTEQPYIWSSAIDAAGNVYVRAGGKRGARGGKDQLTIGERWCVGVRLGRVVQ